MVVRFASEGELADRRVTHQRFRHAMQRECAALEDVPSRLQADNTTLSAIPVQPIERIRPAPPPGTIAVILAIMWHIASGRG
jgi:hypothetical protein